MCGFAGFLGSLIAATGAEPERRLRHMIQAIAHRGPDSDGTWTDVDAGIGLAHKRLSIVDLSPAGAQPMVSASGRYVIVYNGEIYNHSDLRAELEASGSAVAWRGHSDTETLLAGCDAWGIEGTIGRSIGMFAFALWDRRERVLTLGRDRLGEKPLYYGWQGSGEDAVFLFGSELKALRAHPAFERVVDRDALCLFMRHSYIGEGHTIYRGVRKVLPGCLVHLSLAAPEPVVRRYWSGVEVAVAGASDRSENPDAAEVVESLEQLLLDAVSRQMVADVPVGAFLSGGIDSSTVVALMQTCSSRPVHTFSIGFHDARLNEAEHAKRVAAHLGTEHTELYVGPDDLLGVVPRLPRIYDEPFGDSSQIPTILVSELARRHVTVSLSGDGGDELFCGYERYRQARAFWRIFRHAPRPMRSVMASAATAVSAPAWTSMARLARSDVEGFGQRVHRVAGYVTSTSPDELHRMIVSHWSAPPVVEGSEPPWLLNGEPMAPDLGVVERMMLLDMSTYLPDDVLVKVDRASMSVSLESRAPLLDHRVVEYALRLPLDFKLRNGVHKWALREVLYRHVPREIVDRPKMGFSVPIATWLRGPLRDWAEALLDAGRLRREGYLRAEPVRRKWTEHLSGRFDWSFHLWNVLMFQAWLEAEGDV